MTEWGGKIFCSHGSKHSRGVMIMCKPGVSCTINQLYCDNEGRIIILEITTDDFSFVLINTYAPNEPTSQANFWKRYPID